MINRECTRKSTVSANWNNWLSRTGQSNYVLNEIYHVMECFDFANYTIIDSL